MAYDWDDSRVTHRHVDLGEVRLHCVEAGTGPLVVLLHGFPEFWFSWRYQIPALAAAGYRVVAPDMRGYNLSDKPTGVAAYELERLTGDVARLIHACGEKKAIVVGHDWGGVVAWAFAMQHPECLERLAVLNVPHPKTMLLALRTARQLRRSWYMVMFQLPFVPERLMRLRDFAAIRRGFTQELQREGAFSAQDVQRYVDAAAQPGALTAMVNYYRAALRRSPARTIAAMRPIESEVLVIWGQKDRFLGSDLAEPERALVPRVRVERIDDASHWVNADAPERVNELLLDFFRPVAEATPRRFAPA